jgi:hypothetical protein
LFCRILWVDLLEEAVGEAAEGWVACGSLREEEAKDPGGDLLLVGLQVEVGKDSVVEGAAAVVEVRCPRKSRTA